MEILLVYNGRLFLQSDSGQKLCNGRIAQVGHADASLSSFVFFFLLLDIPSLSLPPFAFVSMKSFLDRGSVAGV